MSISNSASNEHESQAEKAFGIIRRKIVDQELMPGSPVVETVLGEELGMSRTPIREAIRRLNAYGLLTTIPRKGTYVRTFSLIDLIGMYELAEGLEGMAAYLVAEKKQKDTIAPEIIPELEKIHASMLRVSDRREYRRWSDLDEDFHLLLYKTAGNTRIEESLIRIRAQLNMTLVNLISSYIDIETSNAEHGWILREIKKGHPKKARKIMQRQHNRMRNVLIQHNNIS